HKPADFVASIQWSSSPGDYEFSSRAQDDRRQSDPRMSRNLGESLQSKQLAIVGEWAGLQNHRCERRFQAWRMFPRDSEFALIGIPEVLRVKNVVVRDG